MPPADIKRRSCSSTSGQKSSAMKPAAAAVRRSLTLALLPAVLLLVARPALAQTETVLYNFCSIEVGGSCQDGASPASNLTSREGNFYGTTTFGGAGLGAGSVFKLSPNGSGGWNETVLYSFCSAANCTDGAYPDGPVVLDSLGNLYGIAPEGGNTNCEFTEGCGVAFELSPVGAGWTETVVYSFCSQFTGGVCHDGNDPGGDLVMDAAGNLYGQVAAGAFELSPSGAGGWTDRLISPNIDNSTSGLTMDASGNIFGLGLTGPTGQRVAFELSPNGDGGWNSTVLYTFSGPNGSSSWSNLVLDQAGNLYGTSQAGGAEGTGTVFELSPGETAWTEKTLFTFSYDNSALDGFFPSGGLVLDASGHLYGTTRQGGTYGQGTLFELVAVGGSSYEEKVIWSFNGTDGSQPDDSPILDSAGNLYGTTWGGGSHGSGVVFEVTPAATAATTTTVTSSKNPSTYPNGVTFTATVAPQSGSGTTPTGTVTFLDGGTVMGTKTLKNGTASYTANYASYTLPAGSNTITAVYGGDVNYSRSTSAPLDQIVTVSTSTIITSTPNPSAYGQTVIFSATVTSSIGAPPNGEIVTFKQGSTVLGTATLSGGTATFPYSALGAGTKAVTVVYSGDTYYNPSTSQSINQVIDKATSTTTLVSSQNPSAYEQSVTFTATVVPQFSGTPTGYVELYNGTQELGSATLVNGAASYTTTKLAVGTGSITAEYKGSSSFQTSTSGAVSQVVNQASTTTALASSLNPSNSGQSVTFTATVTGQFGGTVTGSVTFMDGATTLKTVSLGTGTAKYTTSTLAAGAHTITSTYNGSPDFTTSSVALIQTVN
jgi:uncharacterized repeat protein (TIGR03803 family)